MITTEISLTTPTFTAWVDGFLLDRRAADKRPATIRSYGMWLRRFVEFCAGRGLADLRVEAVDAGLLREFMLSIGGLKATSRRVAHAALRAFFHWWEEETGAGDGWRNPIDRVKAPHVDLPPLDPASADVVRRLLGACKGPQGSRDRATLFVLWDAGLRAGELCGLRLEDLDQVSGALTITKSKSRKARVVYLGRKARQTLRSYLRDRGDTPGALFMCRQVRPDRPASGGWTVGGLAAMVRRRAADAGVEPPPLHAFRRAAALEMHRNGSDLLTISRTLGHAGLGLLQRYVNQDASDLREAAEKFSPGDRL